MTIWEITVPFSPAATDDELHRTTAEQAELQHPARLLARPPQPLATPGNGLVHGQPLSAAWSAMLGRASQDLAHAPRLKELALCAVATLNGAEQDMHHGPLLLQAGATAAQLAALRLLPALVAEANDPLWTPLEHATLVLCVQMTGAGRVSDAAFNAARSALGNDELLFELIAVIGTHNMVSRVLVSTATSVGN